VEECFEATDTIQLAERLRLERLVLEDRLDYHVTIGERGKLCRPRHARDGRVALLLAYPPPLDTSVEELPDRGKPCLNPVFRDVTNNYGMTPASDRDGDPGSHSSCPEDADLLPIRSSSIFLGPGILASRLFHKPSLPSQLFFVMIDKIGVEKLNSGPAPSFSSTFSLQSSAFSSRGDGTRTHAIRILSP
jgi:hypothetical protein